jgi:flagellin
MSLGVLNNLSAMYAENNLNNTTNSLNTVLQQLSSGSKINSGADDAAGLSLVDGLQANSQALAQSQTNAQEGVGLLQVADGALSQVTSLLNRAVTLATEASNGTLNSSQDTAANQEYQSILSEVSNIGSTTTYNGQGVFGSNTNIYTGDSTSTGASVDALNIRTLSSSNVGDSGGAMAYSNGSNNVFVDLSAGGINAASTDSLAGGATGTTTIAVSYMAKGANGEAVQASANITAGVGTNFANTAQGLISAINGAGLGLTASFGTAAQAGTAASSAATLNSNNTGGGSTDTGIIISGAGVGTGTNGAGGLGSLTVGASGDLLGGSLAVVGADGDSHSITMGTANSTDTLANLAATINSANYGVTATVNTAVQNGNAIGTVLNFTSASSAASVVGANVTDASTASTTITAAATTHAATTASIAGATVATITLNSASQVLGGTMTLLGVPQGAVASASALNTIAGVNSSAGAITLGVAGVSDTLANLANTINNNQVASTSGGDLLATVSNGGTVLTITTTLAGPATNTGAWTATVSGVTGTDTAQSDKLTGAPTASGVSASSTIGTLTGTTNTTAASNYTAGTLTLGTNTITLGTSGSTDTLANLEATVNKGNYGVTASLNTTTNALTFTSSNSAEAFSVTGATTTAADGAISATTNAANPNQIGTVSLVNTTAGVTSSTAIAAGDKISFDNGAHVYTTNSTDGLTLGAIATAITNQNWGVSAAATFTGSTAATEVGTLTFTSTSATTLGSNMAINTAADSTATPLNVFSKVSDTEATGNTAYYSVGLSGAVKDSTVQAPTTLLNGGTLNNAMVSNANGSTGTATISYSDSAGASLSATNLTSQSQAEATLTSLNAAITAVAAQDGYVGAQINTLNAVSSVLSTQQENVTSAQNAVQATDYASATSNMSKYEILSQTGISALAQANSMSQEVTKLLQ